VVLYFFEENFKISHFQEFAIYKSQESKNKSVGSYSQSFSFKSSYIFEPDLYKILLFKVSEKK
jgi:hypothetical protein